MLHVLISLLGVAGRVKRILAFPKIVRFDPGSSVKQNTNNIFDVVRLHTVTLFSFDFPSNFLKSVLATHYVACWFSLFRCAQRS